MRYLSHLALGPVENATTHLGARTILAALGERLPRARHKACGVRARAKPLWGDNAGGAGMGVCEWRIMGVCMGRTAAAHSAKVVIPRVGHAIFIGGLINPDFSCYPGTT